MKRTSFFILMMISIFILIGCNHKDSDLNQASNLSSDNVTTASQSPTNELPTPSLAAVTPAISHITAAPKEEMMNLTLYIYGPDDYEKPIEEKIIPINKQLYETNMTEALNTLFEETEIRFNSVEVEKETGSITVDISEKLAERFNGGSCIGTILTKELIDTLLDLPDMKSAIVTVNGQRDCYSDHYSFEGTFTKD